MSEETDKESQTENATEKKLSDSMERGDVPMSREVALVASLACILISMIFLLRERRAAPGRRAGPISSTIRADGGSKEADDVMALYAGGARRNVQFPDADHRIADRRRRRRLDGAERAALRARADSARSRPLSLMKGFSRTFGLRGLTEFLKSVAQAWRGRRHRRRGAERRTRFAGQYNVHGHRRPARTYSRRCDKAPFGGGRRHFR